MNNLISKERKRRKELQGLRVKLQRSEDSLATEEYIEQSPEELLAEIKKAAKQDE